MKKAAIYARVSTPDQKKNYSLPTQIAACLAYAVEKGYEVVQEFREDYTGSELHRPELDKLRTLAEQGGIDAILTFKLDRLARDFVIPFIIEQEFLAYGVEVKYVNARYDESESGDMMKALDAIIAHQEKKNIVERLTRGKRAAIRDGKVIMNRGQLEIYGYNRADKLYVIDEVEKEIVRLIFQWYLEGDENGQDMGSYQIALRLDAMGVPTPMQRHPEVKRAQRSNKLNNAQPGWHRGTISRMLRNEAYTGVLYYGKTKTVKDPRTGKRKLLKTAPEEWISCEIPAIIDRDTFERAKAKAKKNYNISPRNSKFEYLMSQRIRCSKCGYSLWGYTPQNRYSYYKCRGTGRDIYADGKARCSGVIRAELVDQAVWSCVVEAMKHPERILDVMRTNRDDFKRKQSPLIHSLESTTALLVEAQQERERIVKSYIKGTMTEQEYEYEGKIALDRIEELTAEQNKLQAQLSAKPIPDGAIDDVMAMCEKIREGIDYYTFNHKRRLLELLNVTATVQRGETRQDDVLIITGYIPRVEISLADAMSQMRVPEHVYATAYTFTFVVPIYSKGGSTNV